MGRFEIGASATQVPINGAGMAGSTAAPRLAKQGIGAVILDRSCAPVSGARVEGAYTSGLAAAFRCWGICEAAGNVHGDRGSGFAHVGSADRIRLLAGFWGTSIRRVESAADCVAPGVVGRVQTILGFWVPFEISDVVANDSWHWRVAGVSATGHFVSAIGPDRCRVQFTVAWALAPYLVVMRMSLGRLKRMAEQA